MLFPECQEFKRDVLSEEEVTWHILKYGKEPMMQVLKRINQDDSKPPGERIFIEYIITNKHVDDVNWDTPNRINK